MRTLTLQEAEVWALSAVRNFGHVQALEMTGTLRRRCEWHEAVDLIGPLPAACAADPFYDELVRLGVTARQGLHPNFRLCEIAAGRDQDVVVRFHRYDPRHRGWAMAHSTGPVEFVRPLITHWKRQGGSFQDGRMLHVDRGELPTHDELAVFLHAGLQYVEPRERGASSVIPVQGVAA